MKKILLGLAIFFCSFSVKANVFENIKKTTTEIVDSSTTAIKSAAHTLDTSSLSKQMYSDVKAGLAGLAAALKVGVEHVYIVLVKQQVVNAILYALCGVFALFFVLISYWQWGKIEVIKNKYNQDEIKETRPLAFTILFGILFMIFTTAFATHLDLIIMGFVNPEYGAMTDIMHFIQTIKH